jgi:TPR repeat protein
MATKIFVKLEHQMDTDTKKEVFAVFQAGADHGDRTSMSNLGASYANGFFGVEQDYAKAREWYEKAAAEDDWSAMHNLGVLFENGLGVAQDYAKAREWYGKGAKKGDADALASLARLSIREATEAGRYDEALQLQEALAVKVEEEEKKHETSPARRRRRRSAAWPGTPCLLENSRKR